MYIAGWLHPFPWMATPFLRKGVTPIRVKGCSPFFNQVKGLILSCFRNALFANAAMTYFPLPVLYSIVYY